MEEIQLRTSREDIEQFKESILWADIVEELNSWKEGFSREQSAIVDDAASNNPSTASVLMHLGDLNGRAKAVDYMLGILDMFLSIIKSRTKEEKVDDTFEE